MDIRARPWGSRAFSEREIRRDPTGYVRSGLRCGPYTHHLARVCSCRRHRRHCASGPHGRTRSAGARARIRLAAGLLAMEWRSIRVGAGTVCRSALSWSDLGGRTMDRPAARLGMDPRPLAAVSDDHPMRNSCRPCGNPFVDVARPAGRAGLMIWTMSAATQPTCRLDRPATLRPPNLHG
jgi:hypothetical protein